MGAYEHFGSASDNDVVYETNTAAIFVTGDFYPDDKWELSFHGSYTATEGSFEAIDVSLPEEMLDIGDYDYSETHTYSDLDFNQLELSLKGERRISSKTSLYLGIAYYDFADEAPYAYGDQSGSVLYTHSGLRVLF